MSRHTKRHSVREVLVLDNQFMPMDSFPRRKALVALVNGRAHVIDLKTWAKLSVDEIAEKPFHAIVFPKTRAVSDFRISLGKGRGRAILKRDRFVCQYVGCTRKATTVDHVKPRCQGGLSTWSNLVACCLECNQRKAGRTPEEAGMVLKKPVQSRRAELLQRFHELAGTA